LRNPCKFKIIYSYIKLKKALQAWHDGVYNSRTWEAEAGGWKLSGQPVLYSEKLSHLKQKKTKKRKYLQN
jgi:hypothetical protein